MHEREYLQICIRISNIMLNFVSFLIYFYGTIRIKSYLALGRKFELVLVG